MLQNRDYIEKGLFLVWGVENEEVTRCVLGGGGNTLGTSTLIAPSRFSLEKSSNMKIINTHPAIS